MARNVRLHSPGIQAQMKSAWARRLTTSVAEEVAANVEAQGIYVEGVPGDVPLPVEVSSYETDRARSSVTIAHPSGKAVQGKNGALTKAAAEAGLEVTER